jgi:hypothetical protein
MILDGYAQRLAIPAACLEPLTISRETVEERRSAIRLCNCWWLYFGVNKVMPMIKLVRRRDRDFYIQGAVVCAKCSREISITCVSGLTPVFEIECVVCGKSASYLREDVRIKALPERRMVQEIQPK